MSYLKKAAQWYNAEPHQAAAWDALEDQIPQSLVNEFKEAYRAAQAAPVAPKPTVKPQDMNNSWDGIYAAAYAAGAKYPECVAAQWALESAWGQHVSGKNNFFGIKGAGTTTTTWEDYGNGPVTIQASFKDFPTPYDCVDYLITKWYKDYKNYSGVNRASSREECARLLKLEGYATDPIYADKLIKLMNDNA